MGISTIPMSAFVSKSQQTKGLPPLYLGLGLASYIDLEKIWIGCSSAD